MNDWFNNGFDPYEKIIALEANQQQIVMAINECSELLKRLSKQHEQQQQLITTLFTDNTRLQHQLNQLK